jgi:endonuclease/exonuclease/phosphatase family metal-dependent hydrolase
MSSRYTWPNRFLPAAFVLGAGLSLASCVSVTNLLSPVGPRFEGHYAPATPPVGPRHSAIRLVTFNIKYAREIDGAIEVLQGDSLRGADVLALQEMDETGVERVARALRLNYAYYPAIIRPESGKYFGPAVLSRWPIERSWKLLLPHSGWTRGQRRTATAAILRVRDTRLLVYAVHLETPVQISERERRDQAMAIVRDAAGYRGPVVIAGDFNSEGIGLLLMEEGYTWPTRRVGPTVAWFSWDHIFVRGLARPTPASAGVVHDIEGASDHRPVWTVALLTTGVASSAPPSPATARRSGGGAIPPASPFVIGRGPGRTPGPGASRTPHQTGSDSPRR